MFKIFAIEVLLVFRLYRERKLLIQWYERIENVTFWMF